MNRCDQIDTRQLKRKGFDVRISDLDSKKRCFDKLTCELEGKEVEKDYFLYLIDFIETTEQEKDTISDDQNEYGNENEKENKDEDLGIGVDENNKDPEYCMFLENLTEHGKSYKLKISQTDEEPRFLYYEEQDNSDWCDDLQTCSDDGGDDVNVSEDMQSMQKAKRKLNEKNGEVSTKNEVSKRKKINDHKSAAQDVTLDPHNNMFQKGECGAVVKKENDVTTSDSDSDVVILDDVHNWTEVNNKQLVLTDEEPSLREKLMHILNHPYNEKEHEELSKYMEQEKPVCQLKPLRNGRSRSLATNGEKKSLLDYSPEIYRSMLNAAQNDHPKALNLLRMFRFWLEHVPHSVTFQPWREKQILNVRPSENDPTHMQQQMLLEYK